MTVRLTREQLYHLVWSGSIKRLSKQIGISDVAIAKHCRKVNVPVPQRGYWAKLQVGQRVTRPPLPPRDLGTPSGVKMAGTFDLELLARITGKPAIDDRSDESIVVLSERLRRRLGKVPVPRNFSKAHPAITDILKKGEMLRQQYLNRKSPWNRLRLSSAVEQRRLRIINSLFIAFDRMGWRVSLGSPDARELRTRMGKTTVKYRIDVVGNRTGTSRTTSDEEVHDRLFIAISDESKIGALTTRWEDRDEWPLERQLADVVVGIAIVSESLQRRSIEVQACREKQQGQRHVSERGGEPERPSRERIAIATRENAGRLALLANASAWRDAENVRAYVAAVRGVMEGNVEELRLDDWVKWALSEANRLDPTRSGSEIDGPKGGTIAGENKV
jgi:hypothetical protein